MARPDPGAAVSTETDSPADESTADAAIEFDAVSVELGGRRVLSEVSVRLTQRRVAVIGANGSGKSTFARLVNGLVEPSAGRVTVHGHDPSRERAVVRSLVGFVFTNPDAQILMPTVAEDVGLSLRGIPRAERAARVASVLEEYGLAEYAESPAHDLSGGQKQLLALASVLVREPRIVVADEPTTLLDLGNSRLISELLIERLSAQTIIVTHDLELAARCEYALRFRDGRLVDEGEPGEVVARYRRDHA